MIEEIAKTDRKLGIEIRQLQRQLPEDSQEILQIADWYLDAYCKFHELTVSDTVSAIHKFSQRYLEDIRHFQCTGKYPCEVEPYYFELSRQDYDLFLMSSIFFTRHRFEIFNQLRQLRFDLGNCLSIGVGSGIELEFYADKAIQVTAYDLLISPFPRIRHPNVSFVEKRFQGQNDQFDSIFAVETIEHLNNPNKFLSVLYKSLTATGKLFLTTARNVPQFDHFYNFKSDQKFEEHAQKLGFKIEKKVVIPHEYLFLKIDAENIFYVLAKNQE